MRRLWLLLGLSLAASSCEFGEVEIPEGEPMPVVFGIMRPDLDRQWVLVEQTLTGTTAADDSFPSVIPGDSPPLPVTGATVSIANLTMENDPCGIARFTEDPADPALRRSLGLYWGPLGCPAMRAGDTLELRVETADGQVVTGRTEVVGAERMMLRVDGDSVVVPGPTLVLNRDVDTLDAEVYPTFGRAVQVEIARFDSANVPVPEFLMFLDTTAITVPGNLVNFIAEIFGEDDSTSSESRRSIFTAGRYHAVTVALMDDRFFDYMRTGNMPLSGRGFVNHLEGGMGVFGCVVASANKLKVIGDLDDDREGSYRVFGTLLADVSVDISMELYVEAAGEDSTAMAAFVRGEWILGDIDTSVRGFFRGSDLTFTVHQAYDQDNNPYWLSKLMLAGKAGDNESFTMNVYDGLGVEVGTLAVTRN